MNKSELNPELKVGDRIILFYMQDETSVPLGTKGIVKSIIRDPFETDNDIVEVIWENGSTLSLMTKTDQWKKSKVKVEESRTKSGIPREVDPHANWMDENRDLRTTFDLPFFKEYLTKMRDTGIVNMFGSAPLIYAGSDHIERYYGEGKEDDEEFQDFLKLSDQAKDKFILGLVKYAKKKKLDLEIDNINSLAKKVAPKILSYYMLFL